MNEGTPPESELLEQVRNSDVEAFRQLFDRCQPVIFRYVFSCTRQTELSHDIVQEIFLRIWLHRQALKPDLSFLAYAFRIGGNLIRDAARRGRVRQRAEDLIPSPAASEGDNPEDVLQRDMLEAKVENIIATLLPDKTRAVFLLSRFEGKTHQEIAGLLGISVKTVENQITRALKIIRKNLKGYIE